MCPPAQLFGISLILLGAVILWRVMSSEDQPSSRTRVVTLGFACLVLVSGVFCFFLEKDFFHAIGPGVKVPLYTILGTSLAFAMTFSIVELVNQGVLSCACCANSYDPKPIVGTPMQIYIVLGASLAMGALFGFVFGALDVEVRSRSRPRLRVYPVRAPLTDTDRVALHTGRHACTRAPGEGPRHHAAHRRSHWRPCRIRQPVAARPRGVRL